MGSVSVAGPSSYHERRDRLARTCGYLAYLPLDGIAFKQKFPGFSVLILYRRSLKLANAHL